MNLFNPLNEASLVRSLKQEVGPFPRGHSKAESVFAVTLLHLPAFYLNEFQREFIIRRMVAEDVKALQLAVPFLPLQPSPQAALLPN